MIFAEELAVYFIGDQPVTIKHTVEFTYILGAMMPLMAVEMAVGPRQEASFGQVRRDDPGQSVDDTLSDRWIEIVAAMQPSPRDVTVAEKAFSASRFGVQAMLEALKLHVAQIGLADIQVRVDMPTPFVLKTLGFPGEISLIVLLHGERRQFRFLFRRSRRSFSLLSLSCTSPAFCLDWRTSSMSCSASGVQGRTTR